MEWLWPIVRRFRREGIPYVLFSALLVFVLTVVVRTPRNQGEWLGLVLIAPLVGLVLGPTLWIRVTYGLTGSGEIAARQLVVLALLWLAVMIVPTVVLLWVLART